MTIISTATATAVTNDVRAHGKASNATIKVADLLQADGATSSALATVKKGGDKELRESIYLAILAGFPATDRKLFEVAAKDLTPKQKERRKYIQQQQGSRLAAYRRQLKAREEPQEEQENPTKSPEVKVYEGLAAVLKVLQGDNPPAGNIGKAAKSVLAALAALGMELPEEK